MLSYWWHHKANWFSWTLKSLKTFCWPLNSPDLLIWSEPESELVMNRSVFIDRNPTQIKRATLRGCTQDAAQHQQKVSDNLVYLQELFFSLLFSCLHIGVKKKVPFKHFLGPNSTSFVACCSGHQTLIGWFFSHLCHLWTVTCCSSFIRFFFFHFLWFTRSCCHIFGLDWLWNDLCLM